MMTYKEFLQANNSLKAFFEEQKKLDKALRVISPSGTSVVEFGNDFVDAYISVVECALGDENNFFSWFVFENDFGAKKHKVKIKGKEYAICSDIEFFNVSIEMNK